MAALPPFDPITGERPPGIYPVTLDQLLLLSSHTLQSRLVASCAVEVLMLLKDSGVSSVLIGGPLVTADRYPSHVELIFDIADIDVRDVPPILLPATVNDFKRQLDFFRSKVWPFDRTQAGTNAADEFQRSAVHNGKRGVLSFNPQDL